MFVAANSSDNYPGKLSYVGPLITSNASVLVPYTGTMLEQIGGSAWIGVAVQDSSGVLSAPSTPIQVIRAPAVTEPWANAEWISATNDVPATDCACYATGGLPLFRTEFVAPAPPTALSVARATLFHAGLGLHEVYVDGKRVGAAPDAVQVPGGSQFGVAFGSAGACVGDEVLSPPWTNYTARTVYAAQDVTGLLDNVTAQHALAIVLGRGMWDPYPMKFFGAFNFREVLPVGPPMTKAWLHLLYSDGSTQEVVTSSNDAVQAWRTTPGPIVKNNVYIGEVYDGRLSSALTGWTYPGYAPPVPSAWVPALAATRGADITRLQLARAPPARITRAYTPVTISQPYGPSLPDTYVLSFPQNMAGWLSIAGVKGPAGTAINLTFAEVLQADGSGQIDTVTNLAGSIGRWNSSSWGDCAPVPAVQVDTWILAGDGAGEAYTPKFTWHAFQYVRIDNWPTATQGAPQASQFHALQAHVDVPVAAEAAGLPPGTPTFLDWTSAGPAGAPGNGFSGADNSAIDSLVEQSFRSNWAGGIQSDCPGRERLGYGGDMSDSAEAAMYQFGPEAGAFYGKRVEDYSDAQSPAGGFPETAPYVGIKTCDTFGDGTGPLQWGAAHSVVQLLVYKWYGDVQLLAKNLPASRAWITHLAAAATDAGLLTNGLCDFTQPASACQCEGIDATVMGTAFFYQQCQAYGDICSILGLDDEAGMWYGRAEGVRQAWRATFLAANATVLGGSLTTPVTPTAWQDVLSTPPTLPATQDEQLWGLGTGVLDDGSNPALVANATLPVLAAFAANGSAAYVGSFGTSYWYGGAGVDAAGYRYGRDSVTQAPSVVNAVYASLAQKEYPGYGFMLAQNATTLYEHWDNAWGRASFNHAWLGSVSTFLRGYEGGVRPLPGAPLPAQAAWGSVLIRPYTPSFPASGPLPWANVTVATVRGPICTSWWFAQSPSIASPGTRVLRSLSLQAHLPANIDATLALQLPSASLVSSGAVSLHNEDCPALGTQPAGVIDRQEWTGVWRLGAHAACTVRVEWVDTA